MRKAKQRSNLSACLLALIFFVQACSAGCQVPATDRVTNVSPDTKDAEVVAAQSTGAIKEEVTVEAPVVRLLEEDDQGTPHQKFLIALSNGTTVLIAHNIRQAPKVPLRVGDIVTIHGEYIWNRKGGLIHWTHISDTPKHESGWIDLNGVRYQ